MVKDTAEVVAEAVEDAATVAEKVSSEVAEQLPENGRLRTAAVLLENASKEVAEEAHLAQNIIHKVHTSLQCHMFACGEKNTTYVVKNNC